MTSNAAWDLVVIGSGGAAMAAGIEARSRGKRVLLVEHGPLGGTCLNVGCVPSKNLLAAASQRHRALHGAFPMVPTSAGAVDLPALMAQKRELVESLRQAKYADVAAAHGFDVRAGHARFRDAGTLLVDGEPLTASAYVVATGTQPLVPDLAGLDAVEWLTSTTAMELPALPASMVVVGAGFVGLEQAQLWSQLGTQVTVVGRFAPHAEPEVADVVRGVFADEGLAVIEDRAVAVEPTSDGVVVRTASGRQAAGASLLVATGRTPVTGDLALDAAGVQTDAEGFVVVDDRQATSNPVVFAAGDVSRAPQYVYAAARTGRAAAANALGGNDRVSWAGLPAVLFTTPQIASVGLTEAQAQAAGYACDCRVLGGSDIPRALANRDLRAAVKIVADAGTGAVLGVHAALDGAGDVILAATYAITRGMTVDELADTWAPYLTMGEALRLCAGRFRTDQPTSCCA